jgi:hypothetical protein
VTWMLTQDPELRPTAQEVPFVRKLLQEQLERKTHLLQSLRTAVVQAIAPTGHGR